jgi:hypothetical protein
LPTLTPLSTLAPILSLTPLETPTRAPASTNLAGSTVAAAPTATARAATVITAGTIQVDNWNLTFAGAASDPGKNPALQEPDPSNQTLVVFLNVTNVGSQTATFTAFAKIQIMDEQGHVFANDNQADAAARQKYGTDFGSSLAPGATQRLAMAYEVPAFERQFTIVQGNPAGPWTGNVRFSLQ